MDTNEEFDFERTFNAEEYLYFYLGSQVLHFMKIGKDLLLLSQIYDDKIDGLIDEKLYLEKVRDYKNVKLRLPKR